MLVKLTEYSIIDIQGEDAKKYLQGQLTTDVNKLTVGDSTLTAHCDPKGKMMSVFRLVMLSEQHFLAIIHRSLLPSGLDALKKYAVFSKVQFTLSEPNIIGGIHQQIEADICVPVGSQRYFFIQPTDKEWLCDGEEAQWKRCDIEEGIPYFTAQCQQEFLPQALNLQAIEQAISFQKGCYIGQEMVARAKFRGANKRAMYAFKAETHVCPAIGSALEISLGENWRTTGTIISAVNIQDNLYLQAVLSNQLESNTIFRLPEQQVVLTLLPLPYQAEM